MLGFALSSNWIFKNYPFSKNKLKKKGNTKKSFLKNKSTSIVKLVNLLQYTDNGQQMDHNLRHLVQPKKDNENAFGTVNRHGHRQRHSKHHHHKC